MACPWALWYVCRLSMTFCESLRNEERKDVHSWITKIDANPAANQECIQTVSNWVKTTHLLFHRTAHHNLVLGRVAHQLTGEKEEWIRQCERPTAKVRSERGHNDGKTTKTNEKRLANKRGDHEGKRGITPAAPMWSRQAHGFHHHLRWGLANVELWLMS